MAFTLVGTSTGLTAISADGDQGSLTLPSGVTVVAGAMMRGAVMNRLALLVNAFSAPIWTDLTNTVYPAQLASPGLAPTLADGGGTGYTGTVRARVQFLIKDEFNNVIGASELSPISNSVALVNKLIAYTNIAVSPNPAVNARRIYRTATLGTNYFWDVDIDDNTTTTLSNASSDASLSTVAVSAADYVACPAGLDLVSVYKGRAWGRSKAKPDSMYGSAIDDVTSWPIEIPTYPVGAERSGITGFGARRDDLVIFKRASIQKLVGDSEENFRMIRVAEGQGCVAPDSVLVIRDSVYWLDNEGVWTLGADDTPKSLTDDTVRPWFTSADYFNRAVFSISFAQYDPRKHSYDLFLCSTGSTTIDRWVSLDLLTGKWFGPHKTGTFTPSGAAVCSDTSGNPQLVIGASNGFLYAAVPGNYSDGASTAIDFEVKGKFHSGDQPDLTHLWLQPTILTKVDSAGTLTVTPQVGNLNSTTGTAQSHDLTKERERMARIGPGRLCQFQFRQNTAGQGVELYGYECHYITLGRR